VYEWVPWGWTFNLSKDGVGMRLLVAEMLTSVDLKCFIILVIGFFWVLGLSFTTPLPIKHCPSVCYAGQNV